MYLRSQLVRFGSEIENIDDAVTFRDTIDQIAFDTKGLCLGAALDVFNGTPVENLRREFERRHVEFLTQADFDALQKE